MITTYIDKKKKFRAITQQYEVGLYVAIYTEDNPIPAQFGQQVEEKKFHKRLRKKLTAINRCKVIVEESSIL